MIMATPRVPGEQSQPLSIQMAVRALSDQHQAPPADERRHEERIDFVHPVKVVTEDNREFTMLSCDLSATGIRLVGTHRLLGQRVRVVVPTPAGPFASAVRVLWTCPVGDELVENGGCFCS
jgi:hypothetical protein